MVSEQDLAKKTIRSLINDRARPPSIRRKFESLSRLHLELVFDGFKLVKNSNYGPEAGQCCSTCVAAC